MESFLWRKNRDTGSKFGLFYPCLGQEGWEEEWRQYMESGSWISNRGGRCFCHAEKFSELTLGNDD